MARSDLDELMDRARQQEADWRLSDTLSALDPKPIPPLEMVENMSQHLDYAERKGDTLVTVPLPELREWRDELRRLAEASE